MMTASSRCPCGKSHTRLPDGSIGDVPRVPTGPIFQWDWGAGEAPPRDETAGERFRRYRDQIMIPREHRPHLAQAQRERGGRRGQRVDRMLLDEVVWDTTSLRDAQLHRLYANTPVMTPERMQQIIWEDEATRLRPEPLEEMRQRLMEEYSQRRRS